MHIWIRRCYSELHIVPIRMLFCSIYHSLLHSLWNQSENIRSEKFGNCKFISGFSTIICWTIQSVREGISSRETLHYIFSIRLVIHFRRSRNCLRVSAKFEYYESLNNKAILYCTKAERPQWLLFLLCHELDFRKKSGDTFTLILCVALCSWHFPNELSASFFIVQYASHSLKTSSQLDNGFNLFAEF